MNPWYNIGFDDFGPGTNITNQYNWAGVTFSVIPNHFKRITEAGPDEVVPSTVSDPQALILEPAVGQSSANGALEIEFQQLQKAVGMYMGNANGQTVTATLTAYDESGGTIGSVTGTVEQDAVDTFLGIDAGNVGIKKVTLSYGSSTQPEVIDDLMYEGLSGSGPSAPVEDITYDGTSFWLLVDNGYDPDDGQPLVDSLLKVSKTGTLLATYDAPGTQSQALTYFNSALYVADNSAYPSKIFKVNPSTGLKDTSATITLTTPQVGKAP